MQRYITPELEVKCFDSYLAGEKEGNKQVFYYLRETLAEEDYVDLYCEWFGCEPPKEGEG